MPPLEEEKIIGERFAKERERLELSQQKFGDLVGLHQAGVNAVEKEYRSEAGTLRSTSVEKFIRSAKIFNCSMEYLAGMVDDRRSVNDILAELEDYKRRGITIVPANAEQGELLATILEDAKQMPERELRMLAALIRRLTETTTRPTTPEAAEAAGIIDRLPSEERKAALAAVHDVGPGLLAGYRGARAARGSCCSTLRTT
jgi:transcriptional regulator with XRE-family HTH domain